MTIYQEKYGKDEKKKADKERTTNSKPDKEMGAKKEDKKRGKDEKVAEKKSETVDKKASKSKGKPEKPKKWSDHPHYHLL